MTETQHTHVLLGCSPMPLGSYLKALGILRLVSEQVDHTARGWWSGDVFHLETVLDEPSLLGFFLRDYRPTPIVVPWSGADFFDAIRDPKGADYLGRWPESSQRYCPTSAAVIEAILATTTPRFERYRRLIHDVFAAMEASGTREKKDIEGQKGEEQKRRFLKYLRAELSDELVEWIDSAVALGTDEFGFNALLGSGGGSDGNNHFSDNFMQSLWLCLPDFDPQRNRPVRAVGGDFDPALAIRDALFAEPSGQTTIAGRSPGLFSSQDVGGANSNSGFLAEPALNPWNYVLLLEGTLTFAGALARKLGSSGSADASFPFLMRLCSSGAGTLISKETAGRELWLPQWNQPASFREIETLFAEGRLSIGDRYVTNGCDAARAVASLGFDRGIETFQRVGIVRGRIGGDNYNTAVALGAWHTHTNPDVDLLNEIDDWLTYFRRAAGSDRAPSSAQRALRQIDDAIFALCRDRSPRQVQNALIALGVAEGVLATSSKWRGEANLRPVPPLSIPWIAACQDGSPEFRLAAGIASIRSPNIGGTRQHLEPVEIRGRWAFWSESPAADRNVIWTRADLSQNLCNMLQRRSLEAIRSGERHRDGRLRFPGESPCSTPLDDIAAFVFGETDDLRIEALIRGLALCDWSAVTRDMSREPIGDWPPTRTPGAAYCLLKLCHLSVPIDKMSVPLEPTIVRLILGGRLADATRAAARRLTGCNVTPLIQAVHLRSLNASRIAAALMFPVHLPADVNFLTNCVVEREKSAR